MEPPELPLAIAKSRRFSVPVVVHWVLLPWSLLMWWGIAILAANVSGPAPETTQGWIVIIATMVPVFGLGLGIWVWLLRTFKRWSREKSTGVLPNWCYPLIWAFFSWLLGAIGFGFRSWQFGRPGS
jgi:hypothetical protein